MKLADHKICIIEYPRSGGNWLLKMLSAYFKIPFRDLDRTPETYFGNFLLKYFNIPPLARFNSRIGLNLTNYIEKTHVFKKINFSKEKKLIYLIRDPRDVMISYYHFEKFFLRDVLKKQTEFQFNDGLSIYEEITDYIKYRFETESFPYNNWSDHVREALSYKNILIVKYEDLLESTTTKMIEIIKFINNDYDYDKVENIVSYHLFNKEKSRLENKKKEFSIHLRKGIIGDWKEYLNNDIIDYINLFSKELMLLFEYK